ncbi:hypothetical protein T310_9077, partial [Rasamsonia emersonii CBS 393.64]
VLPNGETPNLIHEHGAGVSPMARAPGLHKKRAGALHYEVTTRAAPEYGGRQPNCNWERPGNKDPARLLASHCSWTYVPQSCCTNDGGTIKRLGKRT